MLAPLASGNRPALRRLLLVIACACGAGLPAADIDHARQRFVSGAYEEVIATATAARREEKGNPQWPLLLGEALGSVGRNEEAAEKLLGACNDFPLDLRLRFATWRATREAGRAQDAEAQLAEIERLATVRLWAYRTPAERITLGRIALLFGNDPKKVLEQFYDPIRKAQPELRDSYLATGELALEKSDFALAAEELQPAVKKFPEDPEAWFGWRALMKPSDSEAIGEALAKTFEFNPHHVGAWLLLADQRIDAEEYDEAEKAIASALAVNPNSPEAHACRAVLAHLRNDPKTEAAARAAGAEAVARQPGRAAPDRPQAFAEISLRRRRRAAARGAEIRSRFSARQGATRQRSPPPRQGRRRLEARRGSAAGRSLRRGRLQPHLAARGASPNFRTLNSEHFTVRMDPREADIYGADVLALLERAHDALTKKYGLPLREKTIVEIFPDQKDFAIRTFGLPGGAGYLGVCFGRVITANSPASRPGSPRIWEAMLWHEFCHVVTLTLTKNKMPRWLSEGISVYEERQARASDERAGLGRADEAAISRDDPGRRSDAGERAQRRLSQAENRGCISASPTTNRRSSWSG